MSYQAYLNPLENAFSRRTYRKLDELSQHNVWSIFLLQKKGSVLIDN